MPDVIYIVVEGDEYHDFEAIGAWWNRATAQAVADDRTDQHEGVFRYRVDEVAIRDSPQGRSNGTTSA